MAIAAGIACMVVGAVVVAAATVFVDGGPSYPDEWDPRVTELVRFVEDEKGAPFEHPVNVSFVEDAAFLEGLSGGSLELTDDEQVELDAYGGFFRALGVAQGPLDLQEALKDIDDGGTLAYYDPVDDEIVIRGTRLDLDTEVTIVHELTHAWQDQHYDLDHWNDLPPGEEADALLGLIEGDATSVENAYVLSLSAADQDAYFGETALAVEESRPTDVPAILIADVSWPYALGLPYLELYAALDLVDDPTGALFGDAPTTTEQMLDVRAYLAGDEQGVVPDDWSTLDDDDVLGRDSLGAMSWFLVLADVLDPVDALAVVDAWDADEYVLHDRDGVTCADIVYVVEDVGSSGKTVDEIDGLLAAWTDGLPDGSYEGRRGQGNALHLSACDPGADADVEIADRSLETLAYPVTRLYLWAGLAEQGFELDADADVFACIADTFLRRVTLDELNDPDLSDDRVQELFLAADRTCI